MALLYYFHPGGRLITVEIVVAELASPTFWCLLSCPAVTSATPSKTDQKVQFNNQSRRNLRSSYSISAVQSSELPAHAIRVGAWIVRLAQARSAFEFVAHGSLRGQTPVECGAEEVGCARGPRRPGEVEGADEGEKW